MQIYPVMIPVVWRMVLLNFVDCVVGVFCKLVTYQTICGNIRKKDKLQCRTSLAKKAQVPTLCATLLLD
jgi:hypothetical protein